MNETREIVRLTLDIVPVLYEIVENIEERPPFTYF